MKTSFLPRLALFFAALSTLSSAARADEITVSAAASLRDVLRPLGAEFSRSQANSRAGKTVVRFNFGSSGALQKQIEAGAPVDLFIAAARKNIAQLATTGDIDTATRRILARGQLVLIAPRASKLRSFQDLRGPNVAVIAIGGLGVPAGDYARQTLNYLGLSAILRPKLIFSKDVRAVLNTVASGNADAGLVYKTDALSSNQVRIVSAAPPAAHESVVYPFAIVNNAPNRAGALRFWRFLQTPKTRAALQRAGFNP